MPNKTSMSEEAGATKDRAVGAVKDTVGEVTGNADLERRGEAQNAAGRARQAANTVDPRWNRDYYATNFYPDPEAANLAYERLRDADYPAEDIDVVMSDETRRKYTDTEMGSRAAEGLGVGGAVGGGIGAALAAMFAVGTAVAIPGLGLVVAGPIAAALAGAGAGAAAGGLIGALIGAGIPEERAKEYGAGIREGGVLLGTRARDASHRNALNRTLQSDDPSTSGLL